MLQIGAGFALGAMLIGCSFVPDRDAAKLATPAPETWRSQRVGAAQAPVPHWLKSFADQKLEALIAEALDRNYDLKQVAARWLAARAEARIVGAARQPQVQLQSDTQRFRGNNVGFGPNPVGFYGNEYDLGVNFAWELDVWNRIGAAQQAAEADARAAESDLAAAHLSLAARVAQAWFDLIEAQQQVRVATDSLNERTKIVDLVRGRFQLGLAQGLEVRLALTDLANAEAQVASNRNRLQTVQRSLELLLGRYPVAELDSSTNLPDLPAPVPAGLPAQLLQRRPDLQAALVRLEAADQRLASAEAELLPRLTLTGATGVRSGAFDLLFNPTAVVWNIAGGLTQPLFYGGRLRAGIDLSEANVRQALANYQQSVLHAYREVEQSLAAEDLLRSQEHAFAEAVRHAEENRQAVIYAYRNGLADILTLLDNYRSVLTTRSQYLDVRKQLLTNRIDLCLALGGGF